MSNKHCSPLWLKDKRIGLGLAEGAIVRNCRKVVTKQGVVNPKAEGRNPKEARRPKPEITNLSPRCEQRGNKRYGSPVPLVSSRYILRSQAGCFGFRFSVFDLLSDFGLRPSDLVPESHPKPGGFRLVLLATSGHLRCSPPSNEASARHRLPPLACGSGPFLGAAACPAGASRAGCRDAPALPHPGSEDLANRALGSTPGVLELAMAAERHGHRSAQAMRLGRYGGGFHGLGGFLLSRPPVTCACFHRH